MESPEDSIQIKDLDDYRLQLRSISDTSSEDGLQPFVHVAVKRAFYFHHYLVIAIAESNVLVVHYSPGKDALKAISLAKVISHELSTIKGDKDPYKLLDFKAGVFFIRKKHYPRALNKEILIRISERYGETNYSPSSNNCESLITWILTGTPTCEQLEKPAYGKRAVADAADGVIDEGNRIKSTPLSGVAMRTNTTSLSYLMTKSGDTLLDMGVARIVSKEVTKTAAKAGPAAVTSGIACGVAAAATLPIEATICGLEIHKLHQQKKNGHITKKEFKKQVTKKVSGSATSLGLATALGFLGGFVGQIVVPVPVVGGLIGSAVGGIIGSVSGRVAGSVVSGKIFDEVTD